MKLEPRSVFDPVGKYMYHVIKDREQASYFVGGETLGLVVILSLPCQSKFPKGLVGHYQFCAVDPNILSGTVSNNRLVRK
jgi:hypothetical protein